MDGDSGRTSADKDKDKGAGRKEEDWVANAGRRGEQAKLGIPWKIYISRALSAWGDRKWSYGGSLFLTSLDESGSLRLVGVYGFVSCLTVILLGPVVGAWIDRTKRLTAAQTFLAIQNLAVAVCGVALACYFGKEDWLLEEWGEWTTTAAGAVVIVIGSLANLASQGSKIAVEKDWIVVIAADDLDRLASMNSVFRTIDLTCYLLSPAVLGFIYDFASPEFSAGFIAVWNVVSVIFEYALLAMIYRENPDLSRKDFLIKKGGDDERDEGAKSFCAEVKDRSSDVGKSWSMYNGHPVRNAGIGLSCLYMTVLGLDSITVGFCLHQCVSAWVMGALMGLSALVGVCGSVSFPVFRKRINVHRTGMVGFTVLILALVPCVVSILLPGSPWEVYWDAEDTSGYEEGEDCDISSFTSVATLLTGLVLARFGLWVADISVTQIMQEAVEEKYRGRIGGVQSGLNYAMDLLKFALVIGLPDDDTFGYLVIASFVFIVLGALSSATYAFRHWRESHYGELAEEPAPAMPLPATETTGPLTLAAEPAVVNGAFEVHEDDDS